MIVTKLIQPTDVLQVKIEAKRKQMIISAAKCGLTHVTTLQISQELDQLLNQYSRMEQ